MPSTSTASRWIAPAALILAALVTGLIVLGSGGSGGSGSGSGSGSGAAPAPVTTVKAKTTGARFYTVRSGDTLTAISIDTGVPLVTLQQLNPELDSQALQPGDRLRLRP